MKVGTVGSLPSRTQLATCIQNQTPFSEACIESAEFAKRCAAELGYLPHRVLKRLSVFDLEWAPNVDSLQIDAVRDFLDP